MNPTIWIFFLQHFLLLWIFLGGQTHYQSLRRYQTDVYLIRKFISDPCLKFLPRNICWPEEINFHRPVDRNNITQPKTIDLRVGFYIWTLNIYCKLLSYRAKKRWYNWRFWKQFFPLVRFLTWERRKSSSCTSTNSWFNPFLVKENKIVHVPKSLVLQF